MVAAMLSAGELRALLEPLPVEGPPSARAAAVTEGTAASSRG